jgi:hypothetical protein
MRRIEQHAKFLDSRILEQQIHGRWYEQRCAENLAMLLDREYVKPGERILEVGIGNGLMLSKMIEKGLLATGVCKSASDYDTCKQKGYDVQFCDMSDMPFEDHSFDFIYTRNTFDHSLMPAMTLSEFRRVLKPNRVMFIEFEWYNRQDVKMHRNVRRMHEIRGRGSYSKPRHWSAMTYDQMRWLLKRLDLELLDSFFAYESQAYIVKNTPYGPSASNQGLRYKDEEIPLYKSDMATRIRQWLKGRKKI